MRRRSRYLLITALFAFSIFAFFSLASAAGPPFDPVQFLPGDGAAGPSISIQETPRIAAGGDIFLAVWTDSRTNLTSLPPFLEEQGARDIYAARLDSNGALLDASPIVVNQGFGWQRNPSVAWNGSHWLVVWENQSATQYFYASEILAVRVAPDGTVLDPVPISVTSYQSSSSTMSDVTANGSDWLVVAQGTSAGEGGLLGIRVASDGTVLDPTPAVLVPATYFLFFDITVHSAGGEYMLLYKASSDFKAARFQSDLTAIATPFNVPGLLGGSNGAGYYHVWTSGSDLVGSPMAVDGTLQIPAGAVITPGTSIYTNLSQLAWDGTNWWFSWQHAINGLAAARIASNGTVLDPGGVTLDPPNEANVGEHAIAGRAIGGIQLVWKDRRAGGLDPEDIYTASFDAAAVPSADAAIALARSGQLQADIVAGPDGTFLLAYRSDITGARRIFVQRVDSTGAAIDPEPIEVASGQYLSRPHVDASALHYMVVWSENGNVYARRLLTTDLTLVDATPITVMQGSSPDVAAMNGVFCVVGTQPTYGVEFYLPVAARVDGATGTVLDSPAVMLGAYFARFPRVIRFGNRWFAVWQRNFSHDDIQAQLSGAFLSVDGVPTPELRTYLGIGFTPDVATSGGTALIAYRSGSPASADQDVRGLRILPDGSFPDGTAGFVIADEPDKQNAPSVAWDGAQFLVAWQDKRNAVTFFDERTDIYAARIDEAGTVIDPGGFPIETRAVPEADPAVVSAGGHTLVASSHFRDMAPDCAYRIGIRRTAGTALAGAPPVPLFVASPVNGCAPLQAVFTDQSTGAITSRHWSFGDGSTTSGPSPSHDYTAPGTYTPYLTVTGPGGSESWVEQDLVNVPYDLIATFTAQARSGCAPLSVNFSDASSGGVQSWLWDFGDGNTSTEEEPTHVYALTGSYNVTLTVSDSCGSDDLVRTNYVNVGPPCPLSVFALSDIPVAGTVVNDYTWTYSPNYQFEQITERESGGSPANRYSYLEHHWNFNVEPGNPVTLGVRAYRGSSLDGDTFAFDWSTDGNNWSRAITWTSIGYLTDEFELPTSLEGTVYVRVIDLDRTPGNNFLDRVDIDYLTIESGVATDVPSADLPVPTALRLLGASPNPFNPRTTLRFELPFAENVRLRIYDVGGRLVRSLVDRPLPPGAHEAIWDGMEDAGRPASSGIYFMRLDAGPEHRTGRVVLVR